MLSLPPQRFYSFGEFRVDAAERLLFKGDSEVALTPKAFDTLLVLLENSSHVLTKRELMQKVWPDSFVEENNLAQNISTLRKVLGEQYIQTIPKRGYRFVGQVSVNQDETVVVHERVRSRIVVEQTDETDLPAIPETMYARSGDVNIAYQVIGDAPLDLVFVMGWVSHLEYFWREPSFARFLLRLASFARLILFDKRGTGLSDRVPINQLPTLEQRMDDVRAVMNAETVLFTRIAAVDERLRQSNWEELLRRLRAHIAKEIEWFRGREMDMVGNRPLAIFDGPARAIRCALAITEYASRLGVELRAGLHTGECEMVDGKVAGVAAEIGVCVANEAHAGEVLVSSTVKDLVAGSGIRFEDRGIRVMMDCGEWRLFAVQRGVS